MICSNSDMSLNVGLLKNKICPTNLISSLDRVRSLVRRGNATDKACLDFRKTCDHVLWCPHGKMKIRELGESWIGRLMDDGTLAGKPWALLWTPLLHVLTWDLDNLNTEWGGKTLRNQALKGFICDWPVVTLPGWKWKKFITSRELREGGRCGTAAARIKVFFCLWTTVSLDSEKAVVPLCSAADRLHSDGYTAPDVPFTQLDWTWVNKSPENKSYNEQSTVWTATEPRRAD